jgi:rod shape-determining protein MreC
MVVYRRDARRSPVLLMVIFTSLLLITVDSRGSGVIDRLRSTARDAIAPVQNLVDDAFSPIRNAAEGVANYGALKDQNAQLKQKLSIAQGKLARDRAVGSQVGDLEKLLDLPTIEDATGVAVRVVGGSPGNFQRTVEINKGTSSGINVGYTVVAGAGLVGKVTEASSTRATVTLIDNPGFGVGVRLETTPSVHGIAEGHTGDAGLRLSFLSNLKAPMTVGELLFTAEVNDAAFLPDIPVAKIAAIDKPKGNLEPSVTLTPLVDLNDLTYLKVLRPQAASTSTPSTTTP